MLFVKSGHIISACYNPVKACCHLGFGFNQYENVLFERLWCRTSCLASFLIIKSQESYRTCKGSLTTLTNIYYRLFPDICSSIANEKQPMLMCGHLINQSSAPDPLVSLSACHNICSKSETCCFRVSQPPVLNRLVSCLCVLLSTLPTFSCLIVRPLNDTNSCIAGTLTSNTLFKNGIAAKWHTQRNKKKSGYYGFYQLFF